MVAEKKDFLKVQELKHRARRLSIKEGIFASIKGSFGDHYILPFAIAINVSNSAVAFLGSISGLFGPLSQIFCLKLIEKHSRKKIVLKSVFFESLIWLPLIAISILFYKGILTEILPLIFMLFFSMYIFIANIGVPAWFSWIGDLVDGKYRGRWFSKRDMIIGFISAVLAITASFFLDYLKKNSLTMFGFAILFSLAFISRLISWRILKKQYEPEMKFDKAYYFSFWDFLKQAPKNNFGKFSIFRAFFGFATSMSSVLLAIYFLKILEFSYSTYMIITLSVTLFSLIFLGLWGKFADIYGNYFVLYISSFLISTIPILLILSPSPLYLILVPQFVSGISWAGFNLASGNFIYDNVRQQKRAIAVSYYNIVVGIGIFLGAGFTALLIKFFTINLIKSILIIFVLSSLARLFVILWWIPQIKEIRKIDGSVNSKALKNIILRDVKPTLLEEVHQIMEIKRYLREK